MTYSTDASLSLSWATQSWGDRNRMDVKGDVVATHTSNSMVSCNRATAGPACLTFQSWTLTGVYSVALSPETNF